MSVTEWEFQPVGFDKKLYAVSVTSSNPSAVMIVHHGINEHIGRYRAIFDKLVSKGIDCHAYDMRSHGKSELDVKERVKIDSFEALVSDMLSFVDKVMADRYANSSVPLFIAGHSLGGLIATTATLRRSQPPAGLVLMSPLINVEMNPVLRVQSWLANPLAAMMPWARIVPAVRTEDMSQDCEVCKDYENDPLNFPGNVRVRTGQQIQVGMHQLQRHIAEVTVPVFAQHGDTDRCVSLKALQDFMAKIPSKDKTLQVIPDGYHELLLGPQKDECIESIGKWVLEHARAGQSAL